MAVFCSAAFTMLASTAEPKDQPLPFVLQHARKHQDRPKAPSRQMIYCSYANEAISLSFTLADGECRLTLTDTTSGIASKYTVDSSTLSAEVYVGTLSGSTEIELTTESGNTYIGTLL